MSFTTKKYTINLLLNEVSSLNNSQLSSVRSLAKALSPRAGTNSAKLNALKSYVSGSLNSVLSGSGSAQSLGKTPRTRLLKALKNRKRSSNKRS